MKEETLIHFFKQTWNPDGHPEGIGDDAALLPNVTKGHRQVFTLDTLVEGRHFTRRTPPLLIGRKLVNVSYSDLAGMGATPRQLYLSLTLPPSVTLSWIKKMCQGIQEALVIYPSRISGGDTVSGSNLVLSSAALGETMKKEPVTRLGARPGDVLWVTGFFGYSLQTKHHLTFAPRIKEMEWLCQKGIVKSATDASDGLWRSVELLTPGLGADLEGSTFPVRNKSRLTRAMLSRVLFDGEDFELVFCAGEISSKDQKEFAKKFGVPLTRVGVVRDQPGIQILWNNKNVSMPRQVYDPFKP